MENRTAVRTGPPGAGARPSTGHWSCHGGAHAGCAEQPPLTHQALSISLGPRPATALLRRDTGDTQDCVLHP
jgi:hypothetical protein